MAGLAADLFNLSCTVQGDMRLDVELDTRIQSKK